MNVSLAGFIDDSTSITALSMICDDPSQVKPPREIFCQIRPRLGNFACGCSGLRQVWRKEGNKHPVDVVLTLLTLHFPGWTLEIAGISPKSFTRRGSEYGPKQSK